MLLEASIDLAREPAGVRAARRFVDETLTDWGLGPICDDARLITSELCANAVLHARTDFRVTLRSGGRGHLRIEVRDENGHMSSPAAPRQDATGGRGLLIVDALATSWGAQWDGKGKVVWAELRSRDYAVGQSLDRRHLAPWNK